MTIRHTLLATLAAAALIAPTANARPADIHAPLARAAAKAQPKQDLRSPDARDAGQTLGRSGGYTPGGAAVNAPGATAADSASQLPSAGQPTWPLDPTPISAPTQPVSDGDGSPVPVIPLVAGMLGVLIAALGARVAVRRAHRRTRIAA